MRIKVLSLVLCWLSVFVIAKDIVVQPGARKFTVVMQVNRSTGYSWYLQGYDAHLIQPVGVSYNKLAANSLGAPKSMVWEFKINDVIVNIPQVSHIDFALLRPWEAKPIEQVHYKLIILGKDK